MIVSRYFRINGNYGIISGTKRKGVFESETETYQSIGDTESEMGIILKEIRADFPPERGNRVRLVPGKKQFLPWYGIRKRSIMRRRQETTEMLKESMGDALLS